MEPEQLDERLRDRAPGEAAAGERARLRIAEEFARRPPSRRPRGRVVVGLAAAALALVAALSPPGDAVADWVRTAVGLRQDAPAGAMPSAGDRLPAAGRLLVSSGGGSWIVEASGKRRRLGAWTGASWSPHGRFVVGWRDDRVAALDRRGHVRWSLPAVRQPPPLAGDLRRERAPHRPDLDAGPPERHDVRARPQRLARGRGTAERSVERGGADGGGRARPRAVPRRRALHPPALLAVRPLAAGGVAAGRPVGLRAPGRQRCAAGARRARRDAAHRLARLPAAQRLVLPTVSLWFSSVAATVLIAGAPASSSPPPAYEAACPSGVSGGLSAGYERESLLAGPLAIYPARSGYARYPARFIASIRANLRRDLRSLEGRRLNPRERRARARTRSALRRASDRRYPAFEAAATVAPGHSVTIAVAPQDRAHVGFLFDNRAWSHAGHGYAVADGDAAVTLRGCTFPYTQYQGGFVLDGPRCVTLEAWVDGGTAPERRVLSFGSGDCAG
jgi:hypothetical protein